MENVRIFATRAEDTDPSIEMIFSFVVIYTLQDTDSTHKFNTTKIESGPLPLTAIRGIYCKVAPDTDLAGYPAI